MSAHEIDSQGNVKIYIFRVIYTDINAHEGGSESKCFFDYSDGWDWSRQMRDEWRDADEANLTISRYDDEWIPDDDDAIDAFIDEHEERRDGFSASDWEAVDDELERLKAAPRY